MFRIRSFILKQGKTSAAEVPQSSGGKSSIDHLINLDVYKVIGYFSVFFKVRNSSFCRKHIGRVQHDCLLNEDECNKIPYL